VSRAAVAVVQAFLERASARDYAEVRECLAPDVVWIGTRGGLDEDQVLHGPGAFVDYLREIGEPWDRFDVEVERYVEVGPAVVAFLRETGRSRHGDLELTNDTAMVFRVRAGKIVEATGYLDRDEALRAAGAAR
jgi:ketosteroid isomerase-like protein